MSEFKVGDSVWVHADPKSHTPFLGKIIEIADPRQDQYKVLSEKGVFWIGGPWLSKAQNSLDYFNEEAP